MRDFLDSQGPGLAEEKDRSLFALYLEHVDALVKRVARGDPMEDKILLIERLFGQTFVVDASAYEELYALWRAFREEVSRLLGGMTVNERLWALGLLDKFDLACRLGGWFDAACYLRAAEVSEDDIQSILTTMGLPDGWRR
jgi:hypothetical protein